MTFSRKYLVTLTLFVLAAAVHLYSLDSERVEKSYGSDIFPNLASFLRSGFGWAPFSIGDLLYALLVIFLLYRIIRIFRNKAKTGIRWPRIILTSVNFLLLIYLLFNLMWGLNYNRPGILSRLNITETAYSEYDLMRLNSYLVDRVNVSKREWLDVGQRYPSNSQLFKMVEEAFLKAAEKYNFLKYDHASIKPSLWSLAGNYLGFTGYYNPFTGEAQVNTTTPKFLHPYTACHEVAHQIGFAKEMEANFAGALAAMNSTEPLFRYSVYLDLFFYANRNLYLTDSAAANNFRKELIHPVKEDIDEWRLFRLKHRSFMEPVFRWAYGKFLERNQQPQGIMAYDEVTSFIIAYYKKEGILSP